MTQTFEDQTDISGMPQGQSQGMSPTQMAKSMHAKTAAGHMRKPGLPETGHPSAAQAAGESTQNVAQPVASEIGQYAGQVGGELKREGQNLSLLPNWKQRPDQARSQNPVFQRMANDAWYAYAFGHNFFGDMAKIQNASGQVQAKSIQKQWEEGQANAWTKVQVQAGSAAVNPLGFLLQEAGGLIHHGPAGLDPYYGLHGKQLEQAEEKTARYYGGEALNPGTLLQYAAPESTAARVALGAYGAMDQFMNAKQGQEFTLQNLMWTALAGFLWGGAPGAGKAGGAVGKVIEKAVPEWNRIGNRLMENLLTSKEMAQLSHTAEGRAKAMDSFRQYLADEETVKPYQKQIASASDMHEKLGTAIQNTKTGEMRISFAEREKAIRDLLRKNFSDVENMDELEQKLAEGKASANEVDTYTGLLANKLKTSRDVVAWGDGERPLVNPSEILPEIAPENLPKANQAGTHLTMMLDQIHRGIAGNAEDPMTSIWRALIGHNYATNWIHNNLMASWVQLLGEEGVKDAQLQALMTSAMEGDQAALEALTPEQRFVLESARMVQGGIRRAARDNEHPIGELPNYFPRIRKREIGDKPNLHVGELLTDQSTKSRSLRAELGLYHPEDEPDPAVMKEALLIRQRHDTIAEANQARAREREGWMQVALDPSIDAYKLQDPAAVRTVRRIFQQKGQRAAEDYAAEHAFKMIPELDDNFMRVMNRTIGHRVAAVHAYGAVSFLKGVDTEGEDGIPRKAAIDREGLDSEERRLLQEQGYGTPKGSYYQGVLFHPKFLSLLDRSEKAISSPLSKGNLASRLLSIEADMIKAVMYSPMFHAWNLAGRMGIHMGMHPMTWFQFLTDEGVRRDLLNKDRLLGRDPLNRSQNSLRLRQEAMNAGVRMFDTKNIAGETLKQVSAATGDMSIAESPYVTDGDIPQSLQSMAGLKRLGKVLKSPWDASNAFLWNMANDFMTSAYHIEHQSLVNSGLEEGKARLLAARRAMSWGGMVDPIDVRNPTLHDAARTLMFAPNWWRTWGELLTGIYRQSGVAWDQRAVKAQIVNDLKFMGVALGWQKLTGNAFNYMLSGHGQDGNTPGNQDKVEIMRPEIIRLLQGIGLAQGIDPNTGINPKTGAVLTVENPFARQQIATETAAGFESGQPGHVIAALRQSNGKPYELGPLEAEISSPASIQDAFKGSLKEAAARMSPLIEMMASLGNIDLYSSLANGQLRYMDPGKPTPGPDAMSTLMGLAQLVPGEQNFGYNMQQQIEQQQRVGQTNSMTPTKGWFGMTVPQAVKTAEQSFQGSALGSLLSGLAGINPPYASAEKTAQNLGQGPSDYQYQQINQADQQYAQQMQLLSAQLASGQISPNEWVNLYSSLTAQHAGEMQGLFKGASSYVNGTNGLLDQYYALQQSPKVMTGPGNTFNTDAWIRERNQFMDHLNAAQRHALDSAIVQQQQKYPVVAMYDGSVREYESYQQQWADEQGISVDELRAESAQYGRLYGNRIQSEQYLASHPFLQSWEQAKQQWEMTPGGLLYGMFQGNQNAEVQVMMDPQLMQQAEGQAQKSEAQSLGY